MFALHAVTPVTELEAQEFTMLGVGTNTGAIRAPSILMTLTPRAPPDQEPLGTYAVTSVPVSSTDKELDGWQEPVGGGVKEGILKLSV